MPLKDDELPHPRIGWLVTGGVVLPALAILMELYSGAMAEAYLDPMPTTLHLLLLFTAPTGMFYLIRVVQAPRKAPASAYFVAGFVVTVSGLYAVAYLPAFPMAILAVPLLGVGLLALSPCMALFASLVAVGWMEKVPSQLIHWRALFGGVLIAIILLSGASGRLALLDHGVRLLSQGDTANQERGLSCLQWACAEQELLARSLQVGPAQKRWHALWSRERLTREAYGKAYLALTDGAAEPAERPWTLWQRRASAMARAPEFLWEGR